VKRIRFEADGTVSIHVGKVEIGQGIVTALAQIAAEELDVPIERIRMLPASTADSPDEGVTSGRLSIQDGGKALRVACAELRALILRRAARILKATPNELVIEDGTIRGPASSVSCWELAHQMEGDIPGAAPRPAGEVRRQAELRAGHGAAGDAAWPRGAAAAWFFRIDFGGRAESAGHLGS